jgi:hypothetical protein
LRERMSQTPLEERFSYDARLRMLFVDFRQLSIKCERDIERIKAEVERRVGSLGHAVYAIVNYRGCRIDPSVLASYRRMIDILERSCYLGVTRYGMAGRLLPDPSRHDRADVPASVPIDAGPRRLGYAARF